MLLPQFRGWPKSHLCQARDQPVFHVFSVPEWIISAASKINPTQSGFSNKDIDYSCPHIRACPSRTGRIYASSLIWLKVSKLILDLIAQRWLTSTLSVMSCGRGTKWEAAQSYGSKNQKSCHSPAQFLPSGLPVLGREVVTETHFPMQSKERPLLGLFPQAQVSISNHFPMEPGLLLSEVATLPQKVKYRLKKG